tara:strand:+ start:351 stop:1034 length:684 start_codon:yes stop_codon:yes gene_type:complete
MPDYSKTVIYKIQHEDDATLIYVGSTTDFTKRKCSHKSRCNNPKELKRKIYQMIRDNGGWECFKMIQIKEFPCINKRETEAEEDRFMMELKANMNDHRANRSYAEWVIDNRDKILEKQKQKYNDNRDRILEQTKQSRINNRDKILEQKKQYRINNLDKILEYNKQYRVNNRDKFLEKEKQYRVNNRDKILEQKKQKMTCECGCSLNRDNIKRHKRAKKHLELLKQSQ